MGVMVRVLENVMEAAVVVAMNAEDVMDRVHHVQTIVLLLVNSDVVENVAKIAYKHVMMIVAEIAKILVKRYVTRLVEETHVKDYVLPNVMMNARRRVIKPAQKNALNNVKTSVKADAKTVVNQNVEKIVLLTVKWIVLVAVKTVVVLIVLAVVKAVVNHHAKEHVCLHVKEVANLNVMAALDVAPLVIQHVALRVSTLLQFTQFRKLKKNNHPNYNVKFIIKEKSLCHTIILKQLSQRISIIN